MAEVSNIKVTIVPFGNISQQVIEEIHAAVRYLDLEPVNGETQPVPQNCLDGERGQLNARCLIERAKERYNDTIVLAVTDYDLYAPGLNFIFGQAELRGQAAAISVYRLIENEKLLTPVEKRRIRTEVVHELGHVFGLEHCSDPYCAMYFSNTLMDTDRKGDRLCAACFNLYAKFRRML